MTIIRQVCQMCRAVCGVKEGHGVEGISHGICPACRPWVFRKYLSEVGVAEPVNEDAGEVGFPVIVNDGPS